MNDGYAEIWIETATEGTTDDGRRVRRETQLYEQPSSSFVRSSVKSYRFLIILNANFMPLVPGYRAE